MFSQLFILNWLQLLIKYFAHLAYEEEMETLIALLAGRLRNDYIWYFSMNDRNTQQFFFVFQID